MPRPSKAKKTFDYSPVYEWDVYDEGLTIFQVNDRYNHYTTKEIFYIGQEKKIKFY
ncbi:MAG: hypothetical protein HC906_09975 [Bacteroidales bacterium]|nr:hypothetical protein [Bacteroidales bacterium]